MPSTTVSPSIESALAAATERLQASSDSARLDAEILVARSIDMPRSYLYAHPEDTLDELAVTRLDEALARRAAGIPMAYITGTREFWSLDLEVSPATLVPRPETELLVDYALREIPRDAAWDIVDLGTGSGAIAVAIASERPACRVVATDASVAALEVATTNVRLLDIANVTCQQGDWIEPVRGRQFQVIVSNPPYVADSDGALEALAAEPGLALTSGPDGLDAIRRLSRDCRDILASGGLFLLEHGNSQQAAVAGILSDDGWGDIVCIDDYAGHPRMTMARYKAR